MRSCNNGELCVVVVCGSRHLCNLFVWRVLFALCTGFTIFRFVSHFSSWDLVRYILTLRIQRTHTALGRFWQFLFWFSSASSSCMFSCLLSFCCVSTLSSVLCHIVVRCLCGIPCCFYVLVGILVFLTVAHVCQVVLVGVMVAQVAVLSLLTCRLNCKLLNAWLTWRKRRRIRLQTKKNDCHAASGTRRYCQPWEVVVTV